VANPVAAEVETEALYCNSETLENVEMYSNSKTLENVEMYSNSKALENVEMYSNSKALARDERYQNGERPPVPVRPPTLAPKPTSTTLARSNSHNLPKPPGSV
jgi:hypothetical protein